MRTRACLSLVLVSGGLLLPREGPAQETRQSRSSLIREAVSAAPATVAMNARVMDWQNNVLREGTNGWTCFPSPPGAERTPMCLDQAFLPWAQAWMSRETPPAIDRVGLAYMLQGDAGTSNIDPYATEPTATNQWVVGGPHVMIIAPDPALLEGIPTDPDNGGPWVMWKGTPYAHIMMPVH